VFDTRRVLQVQGGYYIASGVLPFVSRHVFEAVTGPKQEWWLVQTVGGLVTVIGSSLLAAARSTRPPADITVLAGGSAAVLAGIDCFYSAKRQIAPTYLIDAGAEIAIGLALLSSLRSRGRQGRVQPVTGTAQRDVSL
jgi:hypothetical protein